MRSKDIIITITALVFFLALGSFRSSLAASLKFDTASPTVSNGGTFQIGVQVDPGSDSLNSTDIYVLYDSTLLKANSVAAGSLFPTVTNDITTAGKVYIAGMVDDPGTSVSTSGTVATITFQGLKNGSGTLSFDCNTSKIIKNDINATNVIVCSQNGTAAVTVGSGSSSTEPTATPVAGGELPQSGILDSLIKFSLPGMILLLLGGALRFIL